MKRKAIISSLIAMSFLTSGLSFAQGNGDRNERARSDRAHPEQSQRGDHGRQHDRRNNDMHRQVQRNQSEFSADNQLREERGVGPDQSFHRGDRLPLEYSHKQYVVDDWHSHNLSAPPRGYHWVQTGGDYVLIAITTGFILQLFLGN